MPETGNDERELSEKRGWRRRFSKGKHRGTSLVYVFFSGTATRRSFNDGEVAKVCDEQKKEIDPPSMESYRYTLCTEVYVWYRNPTQRRAT
ncbi:hypothetical protein I7I48_12245 [Histoplasma ohiense]|nr:hypothetical protein I7I48_12245 [Histoplasma ohiense (nom. inval.)]